VGVETSVATVGLVAGCNILSKFGHILFLQIAADHLIAST
jgi:hypothetical protein